MDTSKKNSIEQRQQNISKLISGWKERVRKMEEEKADYLQQPEVQEAIARLRLRKKQHGGIISEAL